MKITTLLLSPLILSVLVADRFFGKTVMDDEAGILATEYPPFIEGILNVIIIANLVVVFPVALLEKAVQPPHAPDRATAPSVAHADESHGA